MYELERQNCNILGPLCEGEEDEVTLLTCVEGKMGRAWADSLVNPTCAITLVGDFYYAVGILDLNQLENILLLIGQEFRGKILVIMGKHWEPLLERLQQEYTDSYKSFSRYALKVNLQWFDKDKLTRYTAAIEPEYTAIRIDKDIYELTKLKDWTLDFCSNFITKEDFINNGIGYVVLKAGEIIAGASTYSYSKGKLEITIETQEEYRKKGLALACASKIILECMERGIYPRWDAANLASVAVAEKLGYRFSHEYTAYKV